MGENLEKPQIKYDITDFDNEISIPFIPKIKEKNNAMVPLQDSIKEAQKDKSFFLKNLSVFALI